MEKAARKKAARKKAAGKKAGSGVSEEDNPLKAYFFGEHDRPFYKWDHYFDIYHRHFARFRSRPIRFLEIGVYKGGSLDMWRHYFHADSVIVGVDTKSDCAQFDGGQIKVRIGNQKDAGFLNGVVDEFGPFDIIVDDGGHVSSDQIASFRILYPQMAENGVYLVEDTHTNLWPSFLRKGGATTFMAFCSQKVLELMQWTGQEHLIDRFHVPRADRSGTLPVSEFCRTTNCMAFYDSVVVFEKGIRPEPYTVER